MPRERKITIGEMRELGDARFVAAALDHDSQSDPRQLVGERDCQNVAM
jgi:hypothetical protein